MNNVARSYSDDTAKAIRAVLERAELESLSAQQIRSNLKDIVKLDDYRAVRLARTETVKAFVDEALQVITLVLLAQGQTEQVAQVALLQQSGIVTSNVTPFNLTAEQIKRYNSYLNNVARSYSDDTAKAIRAVLERAELENLPAQQIRSNLKDIVKLDDYRADIVTGKQIGRASCRERV